MNIKTVTILFFLLSGLALISCKPGKGGEESPSDGGDTVRGSVKLTLEYIYAFDRYWEPLSSKNEECKSTFSNYIGYTIETSYEINPSNYRMSATSKLFDNETSQVWEFDLRNWGIVNQYKFSGYPAEETMPGVDRLLFALNEKFEKPYSQIVFSRENIQDITCVISSIKLEENPQAAQITIKD